MVRSRFEAWERPGGPEFGRAARVMQSLALQRPKARSQISSSQHHWKSCLRENHDLKSSLTPGLPISIVLLFAALVCNAQQPAIALPSAAEVDHAIVTLHDLLPDGVSPGLSRQAAALALIRAPRAGTTRVVPAAAIASQLPPEVRRQISLPPQIAIRRTGWPIGRDVIQRAVFGYLVKTLGASAGPAAPARLAWDQGFTASQPNPSLQLVAVKWDRSQNALDFTLRCTRRSECSCLLVHASPSPELAAMLRASGPGAGPRLLVERRLAMVNISPPAPILVHAGKAAMLTAVLDGMHISLPVVSLQRGALGQTVRARDPATHKVFAARVVGAGALSAVLN